MLKHSVKYSFIFMDKCDVILVFTGRISIAVTSSCLMFHVSTKVFARICELAIISENWQFKKFF